MNLKIKPCATVGNAWMVVRAGKANRAKPVAIGLTEIEARSLVAKEKQRRR